MKLINQDADLHMHTINFSDGMNTIDEMVAQAKKLGLKKIAITDHSSATVNWIGCPWAYDLFMERWKTLEEGIEVIKGVEADLLNAKGDVCMDIQGIKPSFIHLAAHPQRYQDDRSTITEAYINALRRFKDNISFVAHLDCVTFAEHVDIVKVVTVANELGIPLEFNAMNLVRGKTSVQNAHIMLKTADVVMVNSDAHCIAELSSRQAAFDFLKEHKYID